MPGFLSRLARPFTSTSTLSVAPAEGAGGAVPAPVPEGAQRATVAAGCFWGVEHIYRQHFDGKGLYDARVGYIGGDIKSPSYRAVCTGQTGRKCDLFYNSQCMTTRLTIITSRRGGNPAHL